MQVSFESQIVKMGQASESARSAVDDGNTASSALLSEYSVTPAAGQSLRTPRTPAEQDTILQVHLNMRAIPRWFSGIVHLSGHGYQ